VLSQVSRNGYTDSKVLCQTIRYNASPFQFFHAVVAGLLIANSVRHGEARQSEFRMDQLALRRFEIYQAHKALKYLVTNGNRGGLETIDGSTIDWTFLNSKVNFDCVQLVGHSFGGATIVSRNKFDDV